MINERIDFPREKFNSTIITDIFAWKAANRKARYKLSTHNS